MEEKDISDNVMCSVNVKSKDDSDNNSSEVVVRLTPTGKISHAKTRVYTQRYRKEWEEMPDFKDWLTSVPCEATRAFCKFCQRNLHAHRLSLLKHMCTLKHQRAAVFYNKRQAIINEQGDDTSEDITYITEKLDTDNEEEDNLSYDDSNYVRGEELSIEDDVQEEIVEESETEETPCPVFKKIRLQKHGQDTLAQAMAHVQSDYLTDNDESVQMEVIVESDPENNESKSFHIMKYENVSDSTAHIEAQKELSNKNNKHIEDDEMQINLNSDQIKTLPGNTKIISASDIDNPKKVFFFSSGGKSYTLLKSKLPQVVLNQINDKNYTVIAKSSKADSKKLKDLKTENADAIASTSQELINKNTSTNVTKSVLVKKLIITTHVLETSKGVPVCGLQVSLYKLQDGRWTFMHESATNTTGNCNDFANSKIPISTGRYKLHFDTEKYYNMRKLATIYPFIEIVFDVKDPNLSYHIPLLLSPFSYSTYKDSHR